MRLRLPENVKSIDAGVVPKMSAEQGVTTSRRLRLRIPVLRMLALFAFSGALVFCLLSLSPLGAFRVEIALDSSASGTSQMFFATNESDFSENRSRSQRVVVGSNQLAFVGNPIRETIGSFLRWDPLDEPSVMEIASLEVRGFLLGEKYDPAEVLRPSLDVSEVLTDGKVAMIQIFSNDGQVIVDIDLMSLYRGHIRAVVVTSSVAGLVALLLGVWVWLAGRRSGRSSMPAGLNWRVFVGVVLGTAITISLTWALVAR